jgi:hypothetical protein
MRVVYRRRRTFIFGPVILLIPLGFLYVCGFLIWLIFYLLFSAVLGVVRLYRAYRWYHSAPR